MKEVKSIGDLVSKGFEYTGKHYLDLQIWKKEEYRALYREKDNRVYLTYDFSDKHHIPPIKEMLEENGYIPTLKKKEND